jgi:hypothetical protein
MPSIRRRRDSRHFDRGRTPTYRPSWWPTSSSPRPASAPCERSRGRARGLGPGDQPRDTPTHDLVGQGAEMRPEGPRPVQSDGLLAALSAVLCVGMSAGQKCGPRSVGPVGLEPTTRGLKGRRIAATVASTCDYVLTVFPTSPTSGPQLMSFHATPVRTGAVRHCWADSPCWRARSVERGGRLARGGRPLRLADVRGVFESVTSCACPDQTS